MALLQTHITNPTMHLFHAQPCSKNEHTCAHWCKKVVTEFDCGIWYMGLLSTVVSRPVLNLECAFSLSYSLKFKMLQNPKQGVKSDPGLTPFNFQYRAYQNATTILWICFAHWKASSMPYLHSWLKKDLFDIYLTFFPVRCRKLWSLIFSLHMLFDWAELIQYNKWCSYLQQCNK